MQASALDAVLRFLLVFCLWWVVFFRKLAAWLKHWFFIPARVPIPQVALEPLKGQLAKSPIVHLGMVLPRQSLQVESVADVCAWAAGVQCSFVTVYQDHG